MLIFRALKIMFDFLLQVSNDSPATGGSPTPVTMSKVIDLYEFLLEAELHQYYSELKNDLKVSF